MATNDSENLIIPQVDRPMKVIQKLQAQCVFDSLYPYGCKKSNQCLEKGSQLNYNLSATGSEATSETRRRKVRRTTRQTGDGGQIEETEQQRHAKHYPVGDSAPATLQLLRLVVLKESRTGSHWTLAHRLVNRHQLCLRHNKTCYAGQRGHRLAAGCVARVAASPPAPSLRHDVTRGLACGSANLRGTG
nr:hypothetical protein Iba_chr11aCG15480 [Ipomoea batatas]